MHAVVIANGDLHPDDTHSILRAELLVAADGGADNAVAAGRLPSVIVGDLDSMSGSRELAVAIGEERIAVDRRPSAKDETDTELALTAAVAGGGDRVEILGALGGARLDHEIANLLLLADPQYRDLDLCIARGGTRVRALHGGADLRLEGSIGDTVSLFPIGGDAIGVTTQGLAYPLAGDTLQFGRARGVSNRIVEQPASVRFEAGVMLVLELAADEVAA